MIVSSETDPAPATNPWEGEPEPVVYVQPNQTTCTHPGAGWLDGGVPGRKYEWSCDVCEGKVKPLTLAEIARWQQSIGRIRVRLKQVISAGNGIGHEASANLLLLESSKDLDQIERAIRAEGKA